MSLKDKLEIGLKPDAPYRKDNLPELAANEGESLPEFQQDEPACDIAAMPGDSPEAKEARKECVAAPKGKGQAPRAKVR